MSIQPIPPRSFNFAHLLPGQTIKIINKHGTQNVDIFAFSAPHSAARNSRRRSHHHHHHDGDRSAPPSPMMTPTLAHQAFAFEYMSPVHTRSLILKLLPVVGDILYDNHSKPMFVMTTDTSGGAHNIIMPACSQERYRGMGAIGQHENCADNLRFALIAALKELENSARFSGSNQSFSEMIKALQSAVALISMESAWVPDPVKFFMNWPIDPVGGESGGTGAFNLEPPLCQPGGYTSLRAERECVVVMSACPMDILEETGYSTLGAEFEVLAASPHDRNMSIV